MNENKATPKPATDGVAPQTKPPAVSSGAPKKITPVASPAKMEIDVELLSRSMARDLARIPQEEWFKIESVPCRVGFTRDMAEGLRFVDAVANVVNQAGGLFATQNLNRRRDLEKCSQEIVDAFRTIITTTVEVARKLNLSNILERHWRLLAAYGPAPKKAERPKPAAKPETAKQEAAVAEVA